MPRYGDKKYWENHYKNSEITIFDWLVDYSEIKGIISSLKIPKETGKILNVGCGNSEFSENMFDDGYHNIKNIDISQTVINKMTERSKNRIGLSYEVMDVCDLKYENNSFDLIIDKSTMDTLLCRDYYFIDIAKMIKEIQRVLKIGGYYMGISYEEPELRMIHLKRKFLKFNIEIKKIRQNFGKGEDYNYIYLCKKLDGADEISEKYFEETIKELIEQEEMEEEDEKVEENEHKDKET